MLFVKLFFGRPYDFDSRLIVSEIVEQLIEIPNLDARSQRDLALVNAGFF